MARRIRLTPFARLLIVLIFAAPIAYLAASYYNGEDGIQNLKELVGLEKEATETAPPETETTTTTTSPATTGEAAPEKTAEEAAAGSEDDTAYEALQERYSELKQENIDLKQTIQEKNLEIQELKRQVRLLQGSSEEEQQ